MSSNSSSETIDRRYGPRRGGRRRGRGLVRRGGYGWPIPFRRHDDLLYYPSYIDPLDEVAIAAYRAAQLARRPLIHLGFDYGVPPPVDAKHQVPPTPENVQCTVCDNTDKSTLGLCQSCFGAVYCLYGDCKAKDHETHRLECK